MPPGEPIPASLMAEFRSVRDNALAALAEPPAALTAKK
jgi:hypothetical protein